MGKMGKKNVADNLTVPPPPPPGPRGGQQRQLAIARAKRLLNKKPLEVYSEKEVVEAEEEDDTYGIKSIMSEDIRLQLKALNLTSGEIGKLINR
jgi:hypothetical protein